MGKFSLGRARWELEASRCHGQRDPKNKKSQVLPSPKTLSAPETLSPAQAGAGEAAPELGEP